MTYIYIAVGSICCILSYRGEIMCRARSWESRGQDPKTVKKVIASWSRVMTINNLIICPQHVLHTLVSCFQCFRERPLLSFLSLQLSMLLLRSVVLVLNAAPVSPPESLMALAGLHYLYYQSTLFQTEWRVR